MFDYLGHTIACRPSAAHHRHVAPARRAVLAEVRDGDRVLDMGTGSGVNAILAATQARQPCSPSTSTPRPSRPPAANATANGVDDRVEIRSRATFHAVDGTFDLIVFDPPFRWFAPRSLLEMATTDENYGGADAILRQVREHLTTDGRILIFFGSSGDLAYLKRLVAAAGFDSEVVATASLVRDGWSVDYFTFRVTP